MDNFTVTEVNTTVNVGNTIPSAVLTLSPNAGYSIVANDFSATIAPPLASVVFSQDGVNILMTIVFDGTTVSSELSVPICIAGESTTVTVNLEVDYNFTVQNASASLPAALINISGPYNSTSNVFTSVFSADANYYFLNTPTCVVAIGDTNSYTLTNSKTFDSNQNLTDIAFTVQYTFPVSSVTGDAITVVASAIALPDVAPIEIRSYTFNTAPLSSAGETRMFIATGTPAANWTLVVNDGTSDIYNYTSIIPSGGQDFLDIVIPSGYSTSYTFTLSGDLISPFPQVNPFTLTQPGAIPIIQTNVVTYIGQTMATSGGNSIIQNLPVTEQGIQWSTVSDFSTNVTVTDTGTLGNDFTSNITGLSGSTKYFVRAYAINSAGTGYGGVIKFITTAGSYKVTGCSSFTVHYMSKTLGWYGTTSINLSNTYSSGDFVWIKDASNGAIECAEVNGTFPNGAGNYRIDESANSGTGVWPSCAACPVP